MAECHPDRRRFGNGLCKPCHGERRRAERIAAGLTGTGKPRKRMLAGTPPHLRVLGKVVDEGECWVVPPSRSDGRAHIGVGQKKHYAYRVVYEALVGPIPEGLTLDHLCLNPSCVNPEHLEPVTLEENLARRRGETRRPYKKRKEIA